MAIPQCLRKHRCFPVRLLPSKAGRATGGTSASFPVKTLLAAALGLAGMTAGALFAPGPALADREELLRRSLSTDEMLMYTLADFKDRMDQLVERNESLRNKNRAAQNKIFSLSQQLKELEDKRISLLEAVDDMKANMRLDAKEVSVSKTKWQNVRERLEQLKLENGNLKEHVSARRGDAEASRNSIAKLKNRIVELEGVMQKAGMKLPPPPPLLREHGLISDVQARLEQAEVQKDLLNHKLQKNVEARDEHVRRKNGLKEQVRLLRKQLQDETERERRLAQGAEGASRVQTEAQAKTYAEIRDLRKYRQELDGTLQRVAEVQEIIDNKVSRDKTQMEEYGKLLDDENVLLLERQKLEEEGERPAQRAAGKGGDVAGEDRPTDELQDRFESLNQMHGNLKEKILQALDQERTWNEKQRSPRDDIEDLRGRLAVQQKRKKPVESRHKDLLARLERYEQKNQSSRSQVDNLKKETHRSSQELKDVRDVHSRVENKFNVVKREMENLKKKDETLREEARNLDKEKSFAGGRLREDVEALRLRRTALASSWSVVDARYRAQTLNTSEFLRDQAQLTEYLAVLKRENQNLQEKILTTMMTLDRLRGETTVAP